jgi:antitoxin component YwqK of YwqJK toxin-antitoxin module
MKLLVISIFSLALLIPCLHAQDSGKINFTDKNGLKQGHWIKTDGKGHKVYEGFFRDGKPVGTFRRFYDNDSLQSVLNYSEDGKAAEAVFFHSNGNIASKGRYVNQAKEGKWEFYSALYKDYLIGEQEYLHNLRNGLSVKYYPDRTVSERMTYTNDLKSGEWTQYYSNGKICLKGNYNNGKLDGRFETFYGNGKTEYSGFYINDSRNGDWFCYNPDGKLKSKINYANGLATDPEVYRKESQYLDSLEMNKGKIADPEKTGTLWQ